MDMGFLLRLWATGVCSGLMSALAGEPFGAAAALCETARPLVIAHRGFSAVAPENTLPAFELALAAGADLVELDVHQTADGTWVVIHDATLDRTTDAVSRWSRRKVKVRDVAWEELQSLDAGFWFHPRFAGTRLPTLQEALRVILAGGAVPVIERKAGNPADLARLLQELDASRRVGVQSFDWRFLREFHEQVPEVILGALGPPSRLPNGERPATDEPKRGSEPWLVHARQTGARLLVWDHRHVDAGGIRAVQQKGFKFWAYTVNEPPEFAAMLKAGVNGLITDQPARLWRFMALQR